MAWYFNIKHPYTGIHTPLVVMLRRHALEHGRRWYVAGELQVSMPREEAPRELDLAPDLLVAMAEDAERSSSNVRMEGAPPALVLEVVTEERWDRDTDEKPALYDAMGSAFSLAVPARRTVPRIQLRIDVRQRDATRGKQHQGMVEQVGDFTAQLQRRVILGGNDRLRRLLADLPPDPIYPGIEQMVGVGTWLGLRAPRLDRCPQPVERCGRVCAGRPGLGGRAIGRGGAGGGM